jgi:DNA-binding PadR family transcriptional regulator
MKKPNNDAARRLSLSVPEFHILLALADGDRHGYAIMKEVAEQTGGRTRLGPGMLYGVIKRMLVQGMVEETKRPADQAVADQRRRYYRITDLGRTLVAAEATRLTHLVRLAVNKRVISKAALWNMVR